MAEGQTPLFPRPNSSPQEPEMQMKFEIAPVAVADIDRAKAFYENQPL
jgi:hypothetical protein